MYSFIEDDYLYVNDGYIEYCVCINPPHNIEYQDNILYMPQIHSIIESYNDVQQAVLDNHNEIKANLDKLTNILKNIPELDICELPADSDYIDDKILIDQDAYICYPGNKVIFIDNGYILIIPCATHYLLDLELLGDDPLAFNNWYSLRKKANCTQGKFNKHLFVSLIRQYVNEHLSKLFNLFKLNSTKSSRK